VRVRRLGRDDLPLVEAHLLALAPADRHARFGAGRGDAAVAAYARGLDPSRARLVGGVDGPSGRLVGLAEAHPAEAPGAYEIAVSVHSDHRGQGLGRRLAAAAVAAAFAAGAATAEFHYGPGNRAVARLAAALGARFPSFPSPPGRAVIEHYAGAAAAAARQQSAADGPWRCPEAA
jgi:GNAT superfamily N-acetyltransferase